MTWDISGAFDTIWHNGLLSKIKSLGIEGNLALLKDYLSDRSLTVVVGGEESERYPIKAGVPQGSLLGPLTFFSMIYSNKFQRQWRMQRTSLFT